MERRGGRGKSLTRKNREASFTRVLKTSLVKDQEIESRITRETKVSSLASKKEEASEVVPVEVLVEVPEEDSEEVPEEAPEEAPEVALVEDQEVETEDTD